MGKSNSLPPSGHYSANYGNFQTEVYAQIRHEAFGEDIGQNSWLTSDEQDRFLAWLELSPGKTLLDVACGAGGPALRIAATTGCSVVGIDVHEQAVTTANSLAAQCGLAERAEFRSTDATGPLPFSDASFDVEGYELEVLRGARNLISRLQPNLFVEVHPQFQLEPDGVVQVLRLILEYYPGAVAYTRCGRTVIHKIGQRYFGRPAFRCSPVDMSLAEYPQIFWIASPDGARRSVV
jgi:SAM-dependent methyltransferase